MLVGARVGIAVLVAQKVDFRAVDGAVAHTIGPVLAGQALSVVSGI